VPRRTPESESSPGALAKVSPLLIYPLPRPLRKEPFFGAKAKAPIRVRSLKETSRTVVALSKGVVHARVIYGGRKFRGGRRYEPASTAAGGLLSPYVSRIHPEVRGRDLGAIDPGLRVPYGPPRHLEKSAKIYVL